MKTLAKYLFILTLIFLPVYISIHQDHKGWLFLWFWMASFGLKGL